MPHMPDRLTNKATRDTARSSEEADAAEWWGERGVEPPCRIGANASMQADLAVGSVY